MSSHDEDTAADAAPVDTPREVLIVRYWNIDREVAGMPHRDAPEIGEVWETYNGVGCVIADPDDPYLAKSAGTRQHGRVLVCQMGMRRSNLTWKSPRDFVQKVKGN